MIGGGGADNLYGVSGSDLLRADDGVADYTIDCGKDDDPDPFLDVGLDPAPTNC